MHTAKPSVSTLETALETALVELPAIDMEAVAHLAYSYYEARGYTAGCPEEDWFRAEQELLSRR